MSRPIKFRLWSDREQKMSSPYDGDLITWHSPSNWRMHYDVMQFTGLTDKNGKEICEGDIVRLPDSMTNKESGYYRDEPIQKIVFKLGSFRAEFVDTMFYLYADKSEILGNIHENPDLLV